MHSNSLANLQKWPKDVSGNSAGRKLGCKNMSTIATELLEQEVDTALLPSSSLSALTGGKPKPIPKR